LRLLLIICVLLLATQSFSLDRTAFTFTRYDLQVQVVPAEQRLSVRGKLALRNDSDVPQSSIALQISSTLAWQSIQLGGKPLTFAANRYTTDIDHTGSVTEAVFRLPLAVPPKGTVELEIAYAGTIPDTRLHENGKPVGVTAHSDWDQISAVFTAVRGIGYVCWYPVAMDSVSLGDGAQFFASLGEWKARHANSVMRLTLRHASSKTVVSNGRLLGQTASADAEGTVQLREYEFAPMGLTPPTFAVADYALLSRPNVNIFHLPGHQNAAQQYGLAAEKVAPLFAEWFGPQREKAAIIELPEGDTPFDSGTLLFTPLSVSDQDSVEMTIAHQLAHASISSPRPWISEGLAHFAQALVRERQDGRKAALAYMQTFRSALTTAESQALSASPSESSSAPGQPLVRASDEIYYRAKAMFIWWMLRDMVGDKPLQAAIHAYSAVEDNEASYVQHLVEAQYRKPLQWFFDDWVYRDRGLPDFRIETAYSREVSQGNYTVTVTVENTGNAAAEVPVIIPLKAGEASQRLMVPAQGKAVVRLQSPEIPTEVTVNDGSVPESDMSNNTFKMTGK
jgi:hypothetical protein